MIISGPFDAKVMLVGEAPGENEILKNLPFVGLSGMELDKMLSESGFQRSNCFATNVCHDDLGALFLFGFLFDFCAQGNLVAID